MTKLYCFGNSHLWALFGGPFISDTRMQTIVDDIELIGWKLGSSGATAYGLLKKDSATGAGEKIRTLLDSETGQKNVLMVFGEVDVSEHIGHHGAAEGPETDTAIAKYMTYLDGIVSRPDIDHVLVASMVPHHLHFRQADHKRLNMIAKLWNDDLKIECQNHGLTYVDWHDCLDTALDSSLDGDISDELAYNPHDPEERHLSDRARPFLLESTKSALQKLNKP